MRSRKKIEECFGGNKDEFQQNYEIFEVLLDIRELLIKLDVNRD